MKYIKAVFFAAILFIVVGCNDANTEDRFFYVSKVIDGDTVILSNGAKVRYIGVDTPETRKKVSGRWVWSPQDYAVEASNLNKKLVESKKVRLESDRELTDKYGRWLRYVFVDDKMVNEELLLRGYATVYTRTKNVKYMHRLINAQKKAKANKKGLWSDN